MSKEESFQQPKPPMVWLLIPVALLVLLAFLSHR